MRGATWILLATALICPAAGQHPYLVVLGTAQDGGYPQAGTKPGPGWQSSAHRHVVSLGLIDPTSGGRWMFEATPDFKQQLLYLDGMAAVEEVPGLEGIFLTHAHTGHYTGLIHLGHEMMGARGVPVYVMPRLAEFLTSNGPWDQMVRYRNIELRRLQEDTTVQLNPRLRVTPLRVPHREEYSEVVGFRIEGPRRSVLFIPDIDKWERWDELGVRIEDRLRQVDRAYLDGTFYSEGEVRNRDMSGIPHPFISESMRRFSSLPESERRKIHFIHFNRTNPVLKPDREVGKAIEAAGYGLARELDRFPL